MKAAIIGYGALGKYMKDVLLDNNDYCENDLIYFDDEYYSKNNSYTYLFNQFEDSLFSDFDFYVCLGYKHLELRVSII